VQASLASGATEDSGFAPKSGKSQVKEKSNSRSTKNSRKKKQTSGMSSEQSIDRHKYTDFIVSLSVKLYVICGSSLRMTVKILRLLKECKILLMEDIPSPNSIANWVQKSGSFVYESTNGDNFAGSYAVIVDESMMVGSEKLLVTLGVEAEKLDSNSLTEGDVRVLDMSVKSAWNSAGIGEVFETVSVKMASPPLYAVSDNASTISKAVRDQGYVHVRDVGHTFGLFVQQTYEKEDDFQTFIKEVNGVKFREIMRSSAYLLPPKQRTIARFMNISGTVDWAYSMLKAYDQLNAEQQEIFSFIPQYRMLINELNDVFRVVNPVLQQLKNEGLSKESLQWSLSKTSLLRLSSWKRAMSVGNLIECYIKEEYGKLSEQNKKWHVSSDIIESLFGIYKERKSPNSMNGVTKQIFFLPLLTEMKRKIPPDTTCFKHYLEDVFLKDLDLWKTNHLSENRVVKRNKLLCA
jgi:hypothetical protein